VDHVGGDGVGGAEHQRVGSVGQRQQHDHLSGRGLLEGGRQHRAGWAAPGLPTVAARSSTTLVASTPSFFTAALAARPWVLATTKWSTRSASTPASARAARKAATARGT
jgi:hypothetical protein